MVARQLDCIKVNLTTFAELAIQDVGPGPYECTACHSSYYLALQETTCYINCPAPYVAVDKTKTCEKSCPQNTWSHPYTRQCISICPDPFWGDESAWQCLENCPLGTYENKNERICLLCENTCSTCWGPQASNCILCKSGLYYNGTLCGLCEDSLYPNPQTRTCSQYLKYKITIIENSNQSLKVVFIIQFTNKIKLSTFDIDSQLTIDYLQVNLYCDCQIYQINQDFDIFTNEIEIQQEYSVSIIFKISHRATEINLNFINLLDSSDTPIVLSETSHQIHVPAQFKETSGEQSLIEINDILVIVYLSIYIAVFILCSILRTQKRMFFIIVYHMQSVNLLILINFQFPKPVKEALYVLNIVNLKAIPVVGLEKGSITNGWSSYYFEHLISNQLPQNNIQFTADYSYNFLENGGMQIFIYLMAFWVIFLISFIMNTIYIIKNKIEKVHFFRALYELIRDLLIRVHEILFYPICVMFFLQMWGANFDDQFNIASFAMAIFVFLYYLIFLRSVYNLVKPNVDSSQKKNSHSKKDEQAQKTERLFLDFKQQDQFSRNFAFLQYSNKVFYVAALVLLNQYPIAQFSIAMTIQTVYFFILIKKRPYLRNILNSVYILGQLLFLGLMIVIITEQIKYQEYENDQKIPDEFIEEFYNYGFAFVIMLQILLGLYTLMFIFNKSQDYYQFLKTRPQWGSSILNKLEDLVFSDTSAMAMQGPSQIETQHIQLKKQEETELQQI